jgi:hypothetical protein
MHFGGELSNVKLPQCECVIRKSALFTSLPRCVGGGWPSNKTKSTERTNVSQSPFDAAMPVRAGGAALRRNLSSKIKAPAAGTALYEVICTEFMTA